MIKKYLFNIQYEWPIIFLFIYIGLQAYYHFNLWVLLPVIVLGFRLFSLNNKKTIITTIILIITIFSHAQIQTARFQAIENFPIENQEIQAFLYTDPFDVQLDNSSIRGEGKLQIIHNKEVMHFNVNFIKWLEEDETVNHRVTEEASIWHVNGKLQIPNQARNFDVFDYKTYLATQEIAWALEIDGIKSIGENDSFFGRLLGLRYDLLNKFIQLNYHEWIAVHNKLLLNIDSEIYSDYQENFTALGIAHFFAISGFHIYFIKRLLNYILLRLGMRIEYANKVIFIFLCIYTWLIRWPVGVIRVLLMSSLSSIKSRYQLPLTRLDILSVIGILLLLVNPLNVLSLGYTLSFIMTFVVILYNQTSPLKHSGIQSIEMTFACLLVSWPIIMQSSFEWNIIQVLIVVMFTIFFNKVIMPTVFLTTLWILLSLPGLHEITSKLNQMMTFFDEVMTQSELFDSFNMIVGKQSLMILYVLILVGLFFIGFIHIRPYLSYSVFLIMYLLIIIGLPYTNQSMKLTMIDVGQGDATLLQMSHNQGNWLIDTGGRRLWEQVEGSSIDHSYGDKNLIPALKALGVNKLDGVIITHPDIDHIGNLVSLSQEIFIEELWVSEYTLNSDIWAEISKEINTNTIIELNLGQRYKLAKVPITIYSANHSDIKYSDSESNESSLIVQIELEGLTILALGDVTKKIEAKIVATYPEIRGDILKIAHHGSDTSTSEELLSHTRPYLALISAGVDNQYGHPHKEVTDKLRQFNTPYLSTDSVGAVQITYHPAYGYDIKTAIEPGSE